jgi:hypothetical protein
VHKDHARLALSAARHLAAPLFANKLGGPTDPLICMNGEIETVIIIWGSTTKNSVMAEGEFYCPRCRAFTHYSRRAVRQYFTFCFIPLFPMGTLGEYVECHQCRGNFDPGVCHLSAGQIEGLLEPWTCPGCQNLNPAAEGRCVRCQTARPEEKSPYPRPPALDQPDRQAAPRPLPRLDPPARKKKVQNTDYWKQYNEPGRCHECGVISPMGEAHCIACGSELGAR